MSASTVGSVTVLGNAYFIQAGATSNAAVISGPNVVNLYVENLDTTNDVFVTWNTNSAVATTAVLPTAGTPQFGVAVQNGQGRIINIATGNPNVPSANVAVIAFSGTPQVIITPVA